NSTGGNSAVGTATPGTNSYLNPTTGNSVEVWGGTLAVSLDSQMGDPSGNVALKGGTFNNTAGFVTNRNFSFGSSTYTLVGSAPPVNFNTAGTQGSPDGTVLQINGTTTGGGYEKT